MLNNVSLAALALLAPLSGAVCAAGPVNAGSPPISAGQRLAATCTGCHGTNGLPVGGTWPVLAGQDEGALAASLKAFKAGTRVSPIMQQIARGYTDEQLEQVAAYFARQGARQNERRDPQVQP